MDITVDIVTLGRRGFPRLYFIPASLYRWLLQARQSLYASFSEFRPALIFEVQSPWRRWISPFSEAFGFASLFIKHSQNATLSHFLAAASPLQASLSLYSLKVVVFGRLAILNEAEEGQAAAWTWENAIFHSHCFAALKGACCLLPSIFHWLAASSLAQNSRHCRRRFSNLCYAYRLREFFKLPLFVCSRFQSSIRVFSD